MRIGIIGGSGIGERLIDQMDARHFRRVMPETPFGHPSAPIVVGTYKPPLGPPIELAMLKRHGEGHTIPPHKVPSRANIFAMKLLGVTHIVATGAVGSLCEEIRPGEIVVCDQIIDRTVSRPRTFFDSAAVHVEFAEPFCAVTREWLLEAGAKQQFKVHACATYIAMEGPAFSTRAESTMHRNLGGHVVGMTAMPEARLAREAEIAYALVALPTDYDCWKDRPRPPDEQTLLAEILSNVKKVGDAAFALIETALADVSRIAGQPSPAHDALRLAIWSDKNRINKEEVLRLAPLWGRYFGLPAHAVI